tara:strand:+ start:1149 stop:1325 length:177 start_codon:yes stop_codon:yes gene_type:complete
MAFVAPVSFAFLIPAHIFVFVVIYVCSFANDLEISGVNWSINGPLVFIALCSTVDKLW